MDRDARAPARPPFGTPQTRPKTASGAGHRATSAAAVRLRVNCHRNPEAVDPRHRHHVAGGQLAEHPVKPAAVGPRAGRLLAVDVPARAPGLAKLLKLAVEGLPVGRDAGITDKPFFGVSFGHILCKP
jgi:hypothetical protein